MTVRNIEIIVLIILIAVFAYLKRNRLSEAKKMISRYFKG